MLTRKVALAGAFLGEYRDHLKGNDSSHG
jgi:hypothetical protein